MGPGEQPASGVGFGAVAVRDGPVDRQPTVEPRVGRIPGHRRVVGVAGGDDPLGAGAAPPLPQGGDGVGEVLEDLVGVHDVEGAVRVVEAVDVPDGEGGVVDGGRVGPGLLQRLGHGFDPEHPAGGDPSRDVNSDRSGTAADVEHGHPGSEVVGEVGGRVRDRARGVGAQDAGGVAGGVGLLIGAHTVTIGTASHFVQQTSRIVRMQAVIRTSATPLLSLQQWCHRRQYHGSRVTSTNRRGGV